MMRWIKIVAILFGLQFAGLTAQACDDQDADGPDVALVLSGGGAKASMQAAAIRVLEEQGVPIHCVVGTSMGAIVGGFYAAGYSGEELETLFRDNDWGEIFRGDIPRRAKPFLQKEQESQYFSGYVAGYTKDGVTLPGGLGTMRGLKRFYRSKLPFIPTEMDFDNLRVPFRAMATNLSTGDPDPLASGDLVDAMLASMAVPGLFPAREYDGEIYVDGGISSQVPVKQAVAMGADIIIAVDLTAEPVPFDASVSSVATTLQLINLNVWRNRDDELEYMRNSGLPYVYILPDLSTVGTSAYDHESLVAGLKLGREATEAQIPELRRIASIAAPARDRSVSRDIPKLDDLRTLVVKNDSVVDDMTVVKRFSFDGDEAVDTEKAKRKLQNLASFGGFGEVDLAINPGEAVLYVDERPLGRNLLQGSVRASNSFNGDSSYGLLARYSRRPFGSTGGEFSLSFEFGTDLGVAAELYRPLGDEGRFFVVPEVFYRSERVIFDSGNQRIGEFLEQYGGVRGRVGRELGAWGIVGIDAELRAGRLSEKITTIPGFVPNEYTQSGLGLIFAADTLDRGDWPTRGIRFESSAQRLWEVGSAASQTDKFKLAGNAAFGGDDLGFLLSGTYQGVRNSQNQPLEFLSLGGFRQLSAYSTKSIPTNEYVLGSAEVYKRLTNTDGVVNFPVFVGGAIEYADVGLNLLATQPDQELYSLSSYIGGQTPIGPVFLGAGFGEAGEKSLFFFIGRSF